MPVEATSKTVRSYLDALVARGDFADYFTNDVSWTTVGSGQELHGRGPVRDFLIWMHTQAFNARPKIKTLVVGNGQAALEAVFVGTHTGEFLGMPASGNSVQVPSCAVYGLQHDKIAALRAYIPWTCSLNSSSERATPAPRHSDQTGAAVAGSTPQPNAERGDHHGPRQALGPCPTGRDAAGRL
jgi:predicted ester cyclase